MRLTAEIAQIQIPVSLAEKAAIERAARRAGLNISAYVLARVLPALQNRFAELTEACRNSGTERFVLAELSSWLGELSGAELREAVASPPASGMTPYLANYVAAHLTLVLKAMLFGWEERRLYQQTLPAFGHVV